MQEGDQRRTVGEVAPRPGDGSARDLYRPRRYTLVESPDAHPGAVVELLVERGIRRRSRRRGRARVLRELAAPHSARAALYRILAHFGISPLYPSEVEAEATACVESPGLDNEQLEDLTHLPFVTIDNIGSRDLDQALYVTTSAEGFEVWYALADASHYVRPGSKLFEEALARGATYYLPSLAAPMLPPALSEGIISLNPEVQRRSVVLIMTIDEAGEGVGTRVIRAVIRSRAQLTYDEVQRFHDAPESSPLRDQEFTESLTLLREVGERRIAEARGRDVITYDRSELIVEIDPDDERRFVASARRRNDVELWNEQISLLCNMEGARLLAGAADAPHVQAVYRVHHRPTPEALASLCRTIAALVEAHGLEPARFSWRPRSLHADGESLADYLERFPDGPEHRRLRRSIERVAMRMSEPAAFSVEHGPHYGVGAPGYSRISAPMREIVGIFTHKELLEHLGDPNEACDNCADEALRLEVIEAGNRARGLQREMAKHADKLVLDQLLRADLDHELEQRPWRTATITTVRPTRIYVELDELPLTLKVYLRHLPSLRVEDLQVDPEGVALSDEQGGWRFVVGQPVQVRVRDHAGEVNRWIFDLEQLAPD